MSRLLIIECDGSAGRSQLEHAARYFAGVIGGEARIAAVSLDCANTQLLARFYADLLGGRQLWAKESSAGVEVAGLVLVMQRVDGYEPPVWPGRPIVHLDLTADDLDAATERALSLGATSPEQPDPRWRVLLDPAGHPFCLTPFTSERAG